MGFFGDGLISYSPYSRCWCWNVLHVVTLTISINIYLFLTTTLRSAERVIESRTSRSSQVFQSYQSVDRRGPARRSRPSIHTRLSSKRPTRSHPHIGSHSLQLSARHFTTVQGFHVFVRPVSRDGDSKLFLAAGRLTLDTYALGAMEPSLPI